MTNKHTQGILTTKPHIDGLEIIDPSDNKIVATITGSTPEFLAMALAAPDMLAACKAAAEFIEGIEFNDTLTEAEEELLSLIKSAIAKARGAI